MKKIVFVSFAFVGATAACGGSAPPPKTDDAPKEEEHRQTNAVVPTVQQELGSIDERAVEVTFAKLEGQLETCHTQGRDRIEYLAGDVKVFLRVGTNGHVRYGYFEESTLGDRDTEKCILDVFGRTQWPSPQGGEAEVRHGFGWSPGGERQPMTWGPEKVTGALDDAKDVKKDVAKCKAGLKGDFRVTAYVENDDSAASGSTAAPAAAPAKPDKGKPGKKNDKGDKNDKGGKHDKDKTGGKLRAIGVVPPSKEGADKADCLVDALKDLRVPSPGSYAAKVSFSL